MTEEETVRNTFLHFSRITPTRDKNESLRIFPALGWDTRLINVQWRRRYTRISRLNTSGTVGRRITRVPYAGVKFREIKNSEIYPLARYTRSKGWDASCLANNCFSSPFRIFVWWAAIWSSCGGWSYCAYLSRIWGKDIGSLMFLRHFGLFGNI